MLASSSRKYVCPGCFRIARTTSRDTWLICGYCNARMVYAPPYGNALDTKRLSDSKREDGDYCGC